MHLKRKKIPLKKENLAKLANKPGVYLFFGKSDKPIYIGKSSNLKNRLGSYFAANLSAKTGRLIKEAVNFSVIKVTSDLEALLLEAKLVNFYKPKFNAQLKDDKHPLYIRISNDNYPRILTARKIDENESNLAFYGPFPLSSNVKSVLKLLRRIFPYAEHLPKKKPCLYSQMGLCDPCPTYIESLENVRKKKKLKREYRKNIRMIKKTLSGDIEKVRTLLEKEMQKLAKSENFEDAEKVKRQIEKIEYITQPITPVFEFVKNPNLAEDIRKDEAHDFKNILKEFYDFDNALGRIEAFDISHLAGISPAASMVTFIDGEADKGLYRHFRIRQKKGQDDTASLKEVAERRLNHLDDWGKPDLILVDGGKPQVSVFNNVFQKVNIPVVGLAKRFETLVIPTDGKFKEIKLSPGLTKNLLQRIRNEAHRFAQKYHHKLLKDNLIKS